MAALSKLYGESGERNLQEILVNARVRIHEEWSRDNWNGGTYGHALYLSVPETLFLKLVKRKDKLQTKLKQDLNDLHNVQNEFIEEVFLEMDSTVDDEWRQRSGLLVVGAHAITGDAVRRIWGEDDFRVFLSHKAEVKKETAEIKESLKLFGISSFVAHEDIRPTRAWQDEIESALGTMDAFVAVMTKTFHDSKWTDQEVGFAFARNVPLIALRLGANPYGFIGKFQALTCSWKNAPEEIVKVLIKNERMFAAYLRALRKCPNWSSANTLSEILPSIENPSEEQISQMVAAYNDTGELSGGFGFNGSKPSIYGPGLVHYLNRWSTRKFHYSKTGDIIVSK